MSVSVCVKAAVRLSEWTSASGAQAGAGGAGGYDVRAAMHFGNLHREGHSLLGGEEYDVLKGTRTCFNQSPRFQANMYHLGIHFISKSSKCKET